MHAGMYLPVFLKLLDDCRFGAWQARVSLPEISCNITDVDLSYLLSKAVYKMLENPNIQGPFAYWELFQRYIVFYVEMGEQIYTL